MIIFLLHTAVSSDRTLYEKIREITLDFRWVKCGLMLKQFHSIKLSLLGFSFGKIPGKCSQFFHLIIINYKVKRRYSLKLPEKIIFITILLMLVEYKNVLDDWKLIVLYFEIAIVTGRFFSMIGPSLQLVLEITQLAAASIIYRRPQCSP